VKKPLKETKDKKTKAPKVLAPSDSEQAIINFVASCNDEGVKYRDRFTGKWNVIESQIRCQHPDDWDEKEDWQSRVFIPQQAKTSETAFAYLDKILFGQPRFYDIQGVEENDKEEAGYIMELIDAVFSRGEFHFENEFVLKEATDIGTAFLKIGVAQDRKGLTFTWRSPHYLKFDPACGHRFYKAKWICDEYPKTITQLIESAESAFPMYSKDRIKAMLEMMESEANAARPQNEGEKALMTVKGFDGTSYTIPSQYAELNVVEFWGLSKKNQEKDPKKPAHYVYEQRIIAVANGKFLLRDDQNDFGLTPVVICRTKPRKYDTYGLGFCENSVDLQDLMNSMVNLGFDSLKICSFDIAMIDESKVKDKASIEYKPKAVWRFKDNPHQAVLLTRQGISALDQIIRGITVLDQFQQEASGVLRQIQGADAGGSTTLGEYNAKLQMADNRFLKAARFVEKDYIVPLVRMVFKILFNPKFFNQALIDRIIGLREVEVETPDPMTGAMRKTTTKVPKLDFNKIASQGDMAYDFKAVGITQFVSRLELQQKLRELLVEVMKEPRLFIMSRPQEIFKRLLQAAEVPDYQDLIKSDPEIKALMDQIFNGLAQGGAVQPAGMPAVPPGATGAI